MLGAILVSQNQTNITNALTKLGATKAQAHAVASSLGSDISGRVAGGGAAPSGGAVHSVQLAYAHSTQTVFYIMAGVMAATFLVALIRLPSGRVQTHEEPAEAAAGQAGA